MKYQAALAGFGLWAGLAASSSGALTNADQVIEKFLGKRFRAQMVVKHKNIRRTCGGNWPTSRGCARASPICRVSDAGTSGSPVPPGYSVTRWYAR